MPVSATGSAAFRRRFGVLFNRPRNSGSGSSPASPVRKILHYSLSALIPVVILLLMLFIARSR